MSTFVFGSLDHGPACRQRARSALGPPTPPVLCGCRPVPIKPADADDDRAEVPLTRLGFAIRTFLLAPIDRDIA